MEKDWGSELSQPITLPLAEQFGRSALYADLHDGSITDIDSYRLMEQIQTDCPEIDIREEQVECLDVLQQVRDEGEKRALVQMATGLGKTTVIAADIRRFLEEKPSARVLFLCHQNRILDQAQERFERILGNGYTYGKFNGEDEKAFHEVHCLFASFQALTNEGWYQAFLPNEFDYVVVDESHHAKAPTYEPAIRHFKPQFLLGMTGTPDRHDMEDIREIFGPERYQKPLEEAIAEGLLTDTEYYVIVDEVEANRVIQDNQGNRFSRKQLNRTIFVPMRDEEMARIAKEKAAELDGPVRRLIFCESIQQTEEFAQHFDKAAAIHSKMTKWQKIIRLHQFRSGEIETLLTVDMFNEGIDVPEINQVLFTRLTQSKTIFLQQLGRGLRKALGKDKVQVLDFVANADRLTMLDRFWKRIKQYQRGEPEEQDKFWINIGDVDFSETLRDVLDILADIETTNFAYKAWTMADSKDYYLALSQKLDRPAGSADIQQAFVDRKGPSYEVLTRGFDGRLAGLKEACGLGVQRAPEGMFSMGGAAALLGTTFSTVRNIIGEKGWELSTYNFGKIETFGITVSQLVELSRHPLIATPKAPPEIVSVSVVAASLKMGYQLLERLADEAGIQLSAYKFGPKIAPGISTQQLEQLKNRFPDHFVVAAPEGVESIKSASKLLGVDFYTVKKIVDAEGWHLPRYKFGGGVVTFGLGPEHLEHLSHHPNITPPDQSEEIISIAQLARNLGVADTTLRDIIIEQNIEPVKHRFGRGLTRGDGLTISQAEKVKAYVVPSMEEDWMRPKSAAQLLGLHIQSLDRIIRALGWTLEERMANGRKGYALSPEQIETIRQSQVYKLTKKRLQSKRKAFGS